MILPALLQQSRTFKTFYRDCEYLIVRPISSFCEGHEINTCYYSTVSWYWYDCLYYYCDLLLLFISPSPSPSFTITLLTLSVTSKPVNSVLITILEKSLILRPFLFLNSLMNGMENSLSSVRVHGKEVSVQLCQFRILQLK